MIKAVSYWSLKGGLEGTGEVEGALLQAKRFGFKGVELAFAESGVLTPGTDEATCRRYRALGEKHGVAIETVASGMAWGCCPSDLDAGVRQKSIELHKGALERAAWLGAKSMLFIPGAVKIPWNAAYGPVKYELAVEWGRHAVRSLLPVAERVGVELCIENVWNGMFYSPVEFAAFVDSFKSGSLGIYFDVGNVLGYHQHPPHWIETLGKRIRRVHLKDFKTAVGNLSGFCDLMAGDVPWTETMKALKGIGYDKTLVAEMIPSDDGILGRASAAMDRIMEL